MMRRSVGVAGRNVVIETGRLARQADGACLVRCDDTMVLAAVVSADPRPGIDFFPLSVEYRERHAAVGRIPPWRNRREARPQDHEVLASRIIDRSIRPLFPDGFHNEVQVMVTVLSVDPDADPIPLGLLAASTALHVSSIPWSGPVAGATICGRGRDTVLFPSAADRGGADLSLFVSVGPQGLLMVEGEAAQVGEAALASALVDAQHALAPLLDVQDKLHKEVAREKHPFAPRVAREPLEAVAADVSEQGERLRSALKTIEKKARGERLRGVSEAIANDIAQAHPDVRPEVIEAAIAGERKRVARALILAGTRFDGRRHDEVRPITSEVGLLPRTHGSALFTRGETQALASATLGTADDQLAVDALEGQQKERFYLHYNFPSFSVGEVRPVRGPGRREIGHGTLAGRALAGVVPPEDSFPYTVRVVSDILESNGSSSMASVCAGCLAMMDAGVPITAPVAGVAMGLVKEGAEVAILTDILGDEDHLGDMDFKICGTREGITAVQMDIKMEGLDEELLRRALEQARTARLHILDEMAGTLEAPRPELAPRAPRLIAVRVRPERIRDVIGPGGSRIREITETTGARLDIRDDGLVRIAAADLESAHRAMARVEALTEEAELGAVYAGRVKTIRDAFAFVELFPGTEGFLHISEVAEERIGRISDILREGQVTNVRVLGVDERGRIRVSRREALRADPTEVRDRFAEGR